MSEHGSECYVAAPPPPPSPPPSRVPAPRVACRRHRQVVYAVSANAAWGFARARHFGAALSATHLSDSRRSTPSVMYLMTVFSEVTSSKRIA